MTAALNTRGWVRPACAGLLSGVLLLITACQTKPPVPDWQVAARSASERFVHAQLTGNQRTAQAELALSRREIASTGRPDLLARLELLACAVQVASVDFSDCPAYEALAQDAASPEQAYAQHLLARALTAEQIAQLPLAQQSIARHLSQGAVVMKGDDDSMGMKPDANGIWRKRVYTHSNADLKAIEDPLSRLLAAGVLLRAGMATPAVLEEAVDTASNQGWRRPLLAWLGVQLKRAEMAGEQAEVARLRRRMQLLTP